MSVNDTRVRYALETDSKVARYVLDFVLGNAGISAEEDRRTPEIFYGNGKPPGSCRLSIKTNPSDTIWMDLLSGKINASDFSDSIPFDIVNAIGFFLLDEPNKILGKDSFDIHGRLSQEKSYQSRMGLEKIPIVNAYASFLESIVSKNLGKTGRSLWPEGKKCAIGLSHDIDQPIKYPEIRAPLIARNCGIKRNLNNNVVRMKAVYRRIRDEDPDDFWTFSEVMDSESRRGFSSTFFFASVNQYTKWGMDTDVRYDVKKLRFKRLFQDMVSRGFEVGLHASYTAYEKADKLAYEKDRLARMSRGPIKGVRHHYWHLGPDVEQTLGFHGTAGFEYDCSLGFNDEMGFRRNVALPFHPWSNRLQERMNVLEIPTFCMDGNLFYKPIEVDQAVERIKEYIRTIRRYGGVGAIDWHGRASFPSNKEYRDWGTAYQKVLDNLASDREIWVTNLGEIDRWHRRRENAIRN